VTSLQEPKFENRNSKIAASFAFRVSSFDPYWLVTRHLSLVTAFSAFLRRHREERAKLLLNFPALTLGASDSLLIVFCHGQDQGEGFLALFARVFVIGHSQ
jgi:hypothetical protein